jgi:hypothetical protein
MEQHGQLQLVKEYRGLTTLGVELEEAAVEPIKGLISQMPHFPQWIGRANPHSCEE